jgi:bifunctional enzyme CysN/CysC
VAFDGYRQNRSSGAFVLIDRLSNNTVGAGMMLDRVSSKQPGANWDEMPSSQHLKSTVGQVTAGERAARFGQKPTTILLTGLTGAGKTTIGYALERRLFDEGRAVAVIDGQNMRLGLNKDLDFTDDGRSENLRRTVDVARLLNQAGMLCICAFVAPNRQWRQRARESMGAENFLLIHLDAPIEVCRQRDTDGMYARADAGEIANFPGVSAPYDPPQSADLAIRTDKASVDESVDQILKLLADRGIMH